MQRASRDDSLHSNKSLTLYRNYQRTVLSPGVALLLVTAGHGVDFITRPSGPAPPGLLTDGHAWSQTESCVRFKGGASPTQISLNLTSAAEAGLVAPFRLVSGWRAYFLNAVGSAPLPTTVTVQCRLKGRAAPSQVVALKPVTEFASEGKMVIYETHLLDEALEATTCEFAVTHSSYWDGAADVLLAELEAYE